MARAPKDGDESMKVVRQLPAERRWLVWTAPKDGGGSSPRPVIGWTVLDDGRINSAARNGGGMVAWDGPTMVNNSVFSNNTDGGFYFPDNPAGVWVAPMNFGGFFVNNPSFTTHQSSFS